MMIDDLIPLVEIEHDKECEAEHEIPTRFHPRWEHCKKLDHWTRCLCAARLAHALREENARVRDEIIADNNEIAALRAVVEAARETERLAKSHHAWRDRAKAHQVLVDALAALDATPGTGKETK